MWSDEDLKLRHAKGDGTLGYLINHSLQGSQLTFKNPYYHVGSFEDYLLIGKAVLVCSCGHLTGS